MKRYWDYSERERANLSSEQVESMLTVELMEAGVVKVEAPQLEPLEGLELPKETFFQVSEGYHTFACVFRTVEQAKAFIDLQPLSSDYDYSCGDKYTFAKPTSNLKIGSVELCKQQDVINAKVVLQKNGAAKKANDELVNSYNEAIKAVEHVTDNVWEDWRDAQAKQRRLQKIVDTLQEYLGICDGDERKARAFLAKAFTQPDIESAMEWFGLNVAEAPAERELVESI